jgi:hypothetical protein
MSRTTPEQTTLGARVGLEPTRRLEAIERRQLQIHDDDVGLEQGHGNEGSLAARDRLDEPAGRAQ